MMPKPPRASERAVERGDLLDYLTITGKSHTARQEPKVGGCVPRYVSSREVVLDVRVRQAAERRIFECTEKRLTAAVSILGRFFGPDWLPSRLRRLKKGKGDVFLQPAILKPLDQFKSNQRLVDLAEHLLNLQDVEGFEVCRKEIETDKIETGLAKLAA